MPITRLYTGDDGQSHIEELDPASHPTLTELENATGISFSVAEPGRMSDWHNAPPPPVRYHRFRRGRNRVGRRGQCTSSAPATSAWLKT